MADLSTLLDDIDKLLADPAVDEATLRRVAILSADALRALAAKVIVLEMHLMHIQLWEGKAS